MYYKVYLNLYNLIQYICIVKTISHHNNPNSNRKDQEGRVMRKRMENGSSYCIYKRLGALIVVNHIYRTLHSTPTVKLNMTQNGLSTTTLLGLWMRLRGIGVVQGYN